MPRVEETEFEPLPRVRVRRRVGAGITVSGALLILVGSVGAATARVATTTTVLAVTTTRAPTTTRPPTTTAAPTAAASERPEDFVTRLGAAIRSGDEDFLFARLHPAVLARYGDPTCRTFIATFEDATADFEVKSVRGPEFYEYATDGKSTAVSAAFTLAVTRVRFGERLDAEIHIALVRSELRWFTDCGDPL